MSEGGLSGRRCESQCLTREYLEGMLEKGENLSQIGLSRIVYPFQELTSSMPPKAHESEAFYEMAEIRLHI